MHLETGRHLYGGARQVLLLMSGLMARGHRCTLVCPADSDIATAARQLGLTMSGMAAGGDLDVGLVWRLATRLRHIQPDLIHVHSRRGADTFGGMAARLAGLPGVLSRRVDSAERSVFSRLKYAQYQRIIAISSCIRDQLAALSVPASKLRLVRSAVTAENVAERVSDRAFVAEFGLSRQAFPMAVVAQLIPRKGHRVFLEVLARLRDEHPEIVAVLFGIGPLKVKIATEVRALGLEEQVRFAGYRPDLNRFIGHFKLLVHPAEREGLGVSVLEAQAAGVPVVGFRASGLVEAVADGKTGLLVSPGDVSALTAAIRRLIEDEEQRARYAAAGPVRIDNEFGVDAMIDGNLAVYRGLVGE